MVVITDTVPTETGRQAVSDEEMASGIAHSEGMGDPGLRFAQLERDGSGR
jgi:hypothetical protein